MLVSINQILAVIKPKMWTFVIDEVKESYELLIKKNIEQKEANESLAEENRKLAKKIDLLCKKSGRISR